MQIAERPLTLTQLAVLEFIRTSIRTEGISPTIREIMTHFGWTSPNAVQQVLDRLEGAGKISRRHNGQCRAMKIVGMRMGTGPKLGWGGRIA